MKNINWIQVAALGFVVLVAVLIGGSLLGGYRGWSMMGPGMMRGWGAVPLNWPGAIFMWMIPLGSLVLAALGIAWLVRAATDNLSRGAPPTQACPNCEKSVQADWRNCPHCGFLLSQE